MLTVNKTDKLMYYIRKAPQVSNPRSGLNPIAKQSVGIDKLKKLKNFKSTKLIKFLSKKSIGKFAKN